MLIARCDFCCNVLDGIDDGKVLNCTKKVYEETGNEHICEKCLDAHSDEFELYEDVLNKRKYVRFSSKKVSIGWFSYLSDEKSFSNIEKILNERFNTTVEHLCDADELGENKELDFLLIDIDVLTEYDLKEFSNIVDNKTNILLISYPSDEQIFKDEISSKYKFHQIFNSINFEDLIKKITDTNVS